jgi:hypothetical protein
MASEIVLSEKSNQKKLSETNPNAASRALWAGIAFAFVFTLLIWLFGDRLLAFYKLPDRGGDWYYWKLAEPSWLTRLSAWGLYASHQLVLWGSIAYAQRKKLNYTSGLHRVNIFALAMNATFIVLHFAQTHLFYDGIAQDVSIGSSQGSVILLLVWVLLMENKRRGLFFGKKVKFKDNIINFARTYHGYVFAWAIVYTFWFHPMEHTPGHLLGFLYMFFLMLQGSLFFTRVHINKWWMLVQEVMVFFHGAIVAYIGYYEVWTMFAFGFAGMFIITQLHGLGLSRAIRFALVTLYIAAMLGVYSQKPIATWNEPFRIPLIEYLSVFVLAGVIGAGLWVKRKLIG